MKIIKTDKAPKALGPYSQAVKVDKFLFTAGQLGMKPNDSSLISQDVKEQAKQALSNLVAVLQEGGFMIGDVVKVTVFLADMSDFEKVNVIYQDFFKEHKPARSAVAVKTLPKNALVEIEAVAYKN